MRAWLLVCAALALAPGQPPAPATAAHPPADRLDHIKTQILAKVTPQSGLIAATLAPSSYNSRLGAMRAWLLVCAALALAPGQPPAPATAAHPPADRLDHIKTQILAKLGLSSRPTPQRAPPRDVVRKILQRAADPAPAHSEPAPSMREIIAIAHRGSQNGTCEKVDNGHAHVFIKTKH